MECPIHQRNFALYFSNYNDSMPYAKTLSELKRVSEVVCDMA